MGGPPEGADVPKKGAPHPAAAAGALMVQVHAEHLHADAGCLSCPCCGAGPGPAPPYYDALAIVESLVAILSGILVWIGLWDLIDSHLLPDTALAKLSIVVVSLAAVYTNRNLYDERLAAERRAERRLRMGLQGGEGAPAAKEGAVQRQTSEVWHNVAGPPTQLAGHKRASFGGAAATPPGMVSPAQGKDPWAARAMRGQALPGTPSRTVAPDQPPGHPEAPRPRMRRLYFDAPPWRLRDFLRASWALLCGLALWIGAWDLVDYHILPALFRCCHDDGDGNHLCILVKGGCVLVGLCGLYVTRSLYGEETTGNAPHFQRLD